MNTFKEITNDHSYEKQCSASDNSATYILISARAHDMHNDYMLRYNRNPSSRWYNKYFEFKRVK